MRLTLRPTPGRLVGWALGYAERGWPVLPIAERGKRPLTNSGLLDASTDTHQIGEWWARWPMANIGLRTGVMFDVLDIDGLIGYQSLEAAAGPVSPPGPAVRTSRGQHWYFAPGNTANRANLLPKVDWRGTNGYVIAPPSVHQSGDQYVWQDHRGPETAISTVPDWLEPYLVEYVSRSEDHKILVLKTQPYQPANPERILAYGAERLHNILDDIVQAATELGYAPRPDGGGRYRIHCPFHEGDNEASMKLYPSDNSFYCFGCQAWGDSMNLRQHRPGGPRAER